MVHTLYVCVGWGEEGRLWGQINISHWLWFNSAQVHCIFVQLTMVYVFNRLVTGHGWGRGQTVSELVKYVLSHSSVFIYQQFRISIYVSKTAPNAAGQIYLLYALLRFTQPWIYIGRLSCDEFNKIMSGKHLASSANTAEGKEINREGDVEYRWNANSRSFSLNWYCVLMTKNALNYKLELSSTCQTWSARKSTSDKNMWIKE